MSVGVSSEPVPATSLLIRPRVNWPKQMTVGLRHLVTVDLALVNDDNTPAQWPLPGKEEITYTFALDGGPKFNQWFAQWAVDDAAVVLHRFGGSYGPAEFVVTPHREGEHSLRLMIINPRGARIGVHELKVTVVPGKKSRNGGAAPAGEDDGAGSREEQLVGAGVADGAAGPETSQDLRIAVDEPRDTWPDQPLPAGTGPTRPDLALVGAGYANEDELVALGPPTEPDQERPPIRLAERYHVLGLSRSPSGRLRLGLLPLFAPGDGPGKRVTFTARCAPTDADGTVFAVIAELPNGPRGRRQLRSVQSARIPPGTYEVTAELLYPFPEHVRFHGLPTLPRADRRHWSAIVAAVPEWLGGGAGPAHLVAAIEISGSAEVVAERIDAVRRLFAYTAAHAESPVSYSVLTYGPHSITRQYPEVPVSAPGWAVTSDVALDVLDRLARLPAAPVGYSGAAQLECVLAELDRRLTGAEGRPVIVTAGGRPAHPRVTSASGIIPCIYRNDWQVSIENLRRQHAGIAFGAIHDTGWPDEIWRSLGNDAGIRLGDFAAPEFAGYLGLTAGYAQLLPLPLIDGLQLEDSPA